MLTLSSAQLAAAIRIGALLLIMPPGEIIMLQCTLGNRAVQRMLRGRGQRQHTPLPAAPVASHGGLIRQGDPPSPDTGYDTKDQSPNASGKGFAIFVTPPILLQDHSAPN